ncbi:MAG: hypothetical protein HYT37_03720 [Candidatus Sungbacteria bacterium]|nr:hypothetical protein [Candidatus Sungbacteria bacterium]
MHIKETLSKIYLRKLSAMTFSRDAVAVGAALAVIAAFFAVLAVDGYMFYDTVMRPREFGAPHRKIIFPDREAEQLLQTLDNRQNEFLKILGEK